MKMTTVIALIAGIIVGIFYKIIMVSFRVMEVKVNYSNELIEECQKELPRNEYCVIVAVPEKKVKED